ncbi:MAG: radical SAM protein [Candidatus Woesearchaeota archaeon]
MKVAGIYPQIINIDPKIQHAVSEPYGLQMILSVAKQDGHDVELFMPVVEENGEIKSTSEDEMVERIIRFKPDVAGFSMYTAQYPMGVRVANRLKQALPNLVTVGGNRYPTFLGDYIDKPFDFFVLKEGETSFRNLLHSLGNGRKFEDVKGITFRRDGKAINTGIQPRVFDLDTLPNALRQDIILKQVYKGISIPPLSTNPHYAIMEYSRCCYNKCKFCDNAGFWGNRVTFRTPKKVVDEMFELKEKGVSIFYFMDLNFTAFPKKTKELCGEMIRRKLDVSWYCMSNISTLDGNDWLLHLMKKAGCYKIAWGIESTSDKNLEKMDKSTHGEMMTNDQARRVLENTLKAGILNQGYYIIGFPWETPESIEEDAEFLKTIPLHQLNIGIFTPIPLSKFHNEMIQEGYKFDPDLEKYDRNTLIFSHKYLDNAKIKELQKKIYNDFYDCPEYLERIKRSCTIDLRFIQSFNEYFEFIGKDMRV